MIATQLAMAIAATATGVLLPKAVPGLLALRRPEGLWADFLQILPAGIVGALATVAALGPHTGTFRPEIAATGTLAVALTMIVKWVRRSTPPKP